MSDDNDDRRELTDEEREILRKAGEIVGRLRGAAKRRGGASKEEAAPHYRALNAQRKVRKGWPKGKPRGPRKKKPEQA